MTTIDAQLFSQYSFDVFGRYSLVKKVIEANRGKRKFKILDVGGRGNPLSQFLPLDEVYYLDPNLDDVNDFFIKGDGCNMPFPDNEFDWVVSADVLEHIPKNDRENFIKEKVRVAKYGVLLVCPVHSKEVIYAENCANDIYFQLFNINHPWLIEHKINGLPDHLEILKHIPSNFNVDILDNNDLRLWFKSIVYSFYLQKYSSDLSKQAEFNIFYNSNFHEKDHSGESYRKLYFIQKVNDLKFGVNSQLKLDLSDIIDVERFIFSNFDNLKNENKIETPSYFQLYWSNTNSFQEEQSRIELIKASNTSYKLLFSEIPETFQYFRMDFINKPAVIKLIDIIAVDSEQNLVECEEYIGNYITKIDNLFIFSTNDPSIIFYSKGSPINKLSVEFEVLAKNHEIVAFFDKIFDDILKSNDRNLFKSHISLLSYSFENKRKLDYKEVTIESLKGELASNMSKLNYSISKYSELELSQIEFKEKIFQLNIEKDNLEKKLSDKIIELNQLENKLSNITEVVTKYEININDLNKENSQYLIEFKEKNLQINSLKNEIEELEVTIKKINENLDFLNNENNRLIKLNEKLISENEIIQIENKFLKEQIDIQEKSNSIIELIEKKNDYQNSQNQKIFNKLDVFEQSSTTNILKLKKSLEFVSSKFNEEEEKFIYINKLIDNSLQNFKTESEQSKKYINSLVVENNQYKSTNEALYNEKLKLSEELGSVKASEEALYKEKLELCEKLSLVKASEEALHKENFELREELNSVKENKSILESTLNQIIQENNYLMNLNSLTKNSYSYRIGNFLLYPFIKISDVFPKSRRFLKAQAQKQREQNIQNIDRHDILINEQNYNNSFSEKDIHQEIEKVSLLDRVLSIQGWVFHPDCAVKLICVYIGNTYIGDTVTGKSRSDVYHAFPDISASEKSGFSFSKFISAGTSLSEENAVKIEIHFENSIKIIREFFVRNEQDINIIDITYIRDNYSYKDISYFVPERPIDVIIPVYNGFEYLEKLFESVYKEDESRFNLIVVDDKSPDVKVLPFLERIKAEKNNILLIKNESNLGFVQTVNKAVSFTKNNFIIINTDVELPKDWISRLIFPIERMNNIATTTPFTNSGTICSFPEFVSDNKLYDSRGVDYVDSLFRKIKPELNYYEIPTGVGFCMGVNKSLVDKIGFFDAENFGKGYGEENDWCRRAIKEGYKNILVPNMYVYHKHGGSFPSEQKRKLIETNLITLNNKHPEYNQEVSKFIAIDTYKRLRECVEINHIVESSNKKILIIDHNIGGGANQYRNQYIKKQLHNNNCVFLITFMLDQHHFEFNLFSKEKNIKLRLHKLKELIDWVNEYSIDEIFINELVGFYEPLEFINVILKIKKTHPEIIITLPIHDYFPICMSFNLLNYDNIYCGVPDVEKCLSCVHKLNLEIDYQRDIKKWRVGWGLLLNNASEIICFSNSSREIILSAYPDTDKTKISVIPHKTEGIVPLVKIPKIQNKTITIGVLGAINDKKGLGIIKDLLKYFKKENLKHKIIIVGYTSEPIVHDNLIITGAYKKEDLNSLILKHNINIIFIPSIWPETFSYTTEEAIIMGIPLAVFNLGAPKERVELLDNGLVLDSFIPKDIIDAFEKYFDIKR